MAQSSTTNAIVNIFEAKIDLADEFGSANAKGIEVKIGEKAAEAFQVYKAATSDKR